MAGGVSAARDAEQVVPVEASRGVLRRTGARAAGTISGGSRGTVTIVLVARVRARAGSAAVRARGLSRAAVDGVVMTTGPEAFAVLATTSVRVLVAATEDEITVMVGVHMSGVTRGRAARVMRVRVTVETVRGRAVARIVRATGVPTRMAVTSVALAVSGAKAAGPGSSAVPVVIVRALAVAGNVMAATRADASAAAVDVRSTGAVKGRAVRVIEARETIVIGPTRAAGRIPDPSEATGPLTNPAAPVMAGRDRGTIVAVVSGPAAASAARGVAPGRTGVPAGPGNGVMTAIADLEARRERRAVASRAAERDVPARAGSNGLAETVAAVRRDGPGTGVPATPRIVRTRVIGGSVSRAPVRDAIGVPVTGMNEVPGGSAVTRVVPVGRVVGTGRKAVAGMPGRTAGHRKTVSSARATTIRSCQTRSPAVSWTRRRGQS
jgi:hypothetical protein